MSYSISTVIGDNFDIDKILLVLQNEINEETFKLQKNKFNIFTEQVFKNNNIPYGPSLPNSIGINIHLLNDISLNYYMQKIINISKKYSILNQSDDLSMLHTIIYYDNEKFYVISNENWKNNPSLKNTIYDDRFSLSIRREDSFFKKISMKILQRDLNKLRKILG